MPEPRQVPNLENNIRAISAGGVHSGAIDTDGNAYLWGHGGNGRLGMGDTRHRWRPSAIANASFAGRAHHYNSSDGSGSNTHSRRSSIDPPLPTPPATVSGISMGANFTCFVIGKSQLFACGNNSYGQIGCHPATNADRLSPVAVALPKALAGGDVAQISCGRERTYIKVLKRDG